MAARKAGSAAASDEPIDYTDIPELADDDAFWAQEPVRRAPKQAVSLRVDQDVLDWFKGQGEGYQTRMNWALRLYMTKAQRAGVRRRRQR
jgi:uncharacterized protein (DUF4415 family)